MKNIGKQLLLCSITLLWLGTAAAAPAPAASTPLELVVLGSGGPGATGRAASSYLILVDGVARILVDAGPGAFVRLGESGLSLGQTDIVLLTHLHADHVGDLPGLLKARAVSGEGALRLRVFGPDGHAADAQHAYFPSTSALLRLLFGPSGAYAYLQNFAAPLHLEAHDVPAALGPRSVLRQLYKQDGLLISAIAGHHRDAPALLYRIDYAGKSISFSGDIDAQGWPDLRRIAEATDLLVVNTVVRDPPGSPAVLYTLHTPPRAIGQLAHEVGAGRLLLSHLSPAVEHARDEVQAAIAEAYQGPLDWAEDGMHVLP